MIDNSKKRSRDKSDTPPGASWVLVKLEDKINIIKSWEHETPESLPLFVMPEAIESDGYYFAAHSREDFKIVYTDILRLESVGVDIWYDRSMEPSKDWRELAKRMMNRQECKGVIVYGTMNSMVSEPVQTELLLADELGKNIIFINHGEDLKTTAAKNLYEEACKDKEAKEAEETTKEDRERVERFEELLTRIGNADITYIDLAHNAARKKELLDAIKPEEVLIIYKFGLGAEITGVKYLGVKSVEIPKNVTIDGKEYDVIRIGACAFANCRALEMVALPESLEYMGEHAFFGCESLTRVHLGKKVTVIAENAFDNCTGLEEFVAEELTVEETEKSMRYSKFFTKDGVLYERYGMDRTQPSRIYGVPPRLRGEISLPYGLREVRRYAFSNCKNLVSVAIPTTVESIGDSAFERCSSLTSVTIGDGVTSIGDYAFWDCTSLTSVTIGNSVTSIGRSAFWSCDSLTSVTIPDSVTSIGEDAFSGCTSLTSVAIPDSVTSIEDSAFAWCTSLTSLTIPDSVTSIGSGAFRACTSLTSVTIPDSVTSIGSGAFRACTSLTSITIPDSVTSIGMYTFNRCGALRHVAFSGTAEQWKELTKMSIGGWASGCPCETVKCKDGEVPVTEHDRVSIYDLEFDIEEPDGDEEE